MIIPLTIEAARHIAFNLRWTWQREVEASLPERGLPHELEAWAERLVALPCEKVCIATPDGTPVIMGGIIQQGHVGTTWVAGTDRVDEVAVAWMRAVLRVHRTVQAAGVRRFQAYCLDGPDALFTWLDRLGYSIEGRHPGMGVHGETYISFGKA